MITASLVGCDEVEATVLVCCVVVVAVVDVESGLGGCVVVGVTVAGPTVVVVVAWGVLGVVVASGVVVVVTGAVVEVVVVGSSTVTVVASLMPSNSFRPSLNAVSLP